MRERIARSRRTGKALGVVAVVAALGIAIPVSANLAGSGFDAGDGNLVLNDDGAGGNEDLQDWENAPNFGKTIDKLKGQSDDALGEGTSEDDPVPNLKTDGIPPNKSDITRFYVGSETVTGPPLRNFLYLAWERITDPSGTTNFDFELNQSATPSANGATPVRTAGDVLIKYDLANGGTNPDLGFHRWVTSGSSAGAVCEASSKFPCWDKEHEIAGANFEAEINTVAVTDPIDPDGGPNPATPGSDPKSRLLPVRTFGEAAIDLIGAGILQAGSCEGFASAYLKSRSSDAFNSAIKDFAKPVPTNINNCGGLQVQKYIDIDEDGEQDPNERSVPPVVSGDLGGWSVTVTGALGFSCTGTTNASGVLTSCLKADDTPANLGGLAPGTYTVQENANASKTIGDNSATFYNTDPGPKPATPPVSQTGNVNIGTTTTVDLGNTCYNTAIFEVTSVPTDQSGLFVRYWTTDPQATTDVNMTKVGTSSTYRATAGGFLKSTVVHWEFGLNSDPSNRVAGTDITMPGYPACQSSNSVPFGTATISGLKYKDLNVDGTRDLPGDGPLAGFTIQLKKGGNVQSSTITDANGAFSFSNIDPGTYVLHEVSTTGWIQTDPASNGDITVTVPLGATSVTTYGNPASPIQFGNSPLSKIDVSFTSLGQLRNASGANTGPATRATSIQCTSGGQSVGGSTNSNSATATNLDLNKSAVTCVIQYEDP